MKLKEYYPEQSPGETMTHRPRERPSTDVTAPAVPQAAPTGMPEDSHPSGGEAIPPLLPPPEHEERHDCLSSTPRWRPAAEPTCCGSGCADCPF